MGNTASSSGPSTLGKSRSNYIEYANAMKAQNKQIDMSTIDPYDVLNVSKTCTFEELKKAYKRVALFVHPDHGGSDQLFQTASECFRTVARDIKAREEKTPLELRAGYQDFISNQNQYGGGGGGGNEPAIMRPVGNSASEKVDFQKRFNRAFEENKFDEDDGTSHGTGYGEQMDKSNKARPDFEVPKIMKKYNKKSFNAIFESVTLPDTKEVIVYREPEALPLAKSLQYTELGRENTGDFSSTNEGESCRSLQYTDYMKAHTTTRLVDPRAVQPRHVYNTVDEYDNARAEILSAPVSDEELQWRAKKEREAEKREADRLYRLHQRDNKATLYHDKVSQLMINR